MKHTDLTEHETASETVFQGKLLQVKCDTVRLPDGKSATREYVEHNGAVMIIPVLASGELVMERQYRYVMRRHCIEFPAGKIDPGEEPLATARRELQEECGLTGGAWRELAVFWTTPGFCRERMHLFAAEGVVRGEPSPAEDEELELVRWPLGEVGERLAEIEDAKTLAGLLLYLRARPGGTRPG